MTAPGTLVVERAYPDAWRALADLPLLASEPWHRAMGSRFDGEPVWLWTPGETGTRDAPDGDAPDGDAPGRGAGSTPAAGLAGFVVSHRDAYVYGNAAALLTDPASPFASDRVAAALEAAAVDPDRLLPHLLVTCPGYSTVPVGAASADPAALRSLLGGVLEWAAAERLAAVALPYVASASPLAAAARATGFRGWRLTEDSHLDVPEGGFEAYLGRFGSHRRQRIRAERRRLHERGLRGHLVEPVSSTLLERMASLRAGQRRRYGLAADAAAEHRRLAGIITALDGLVDVFVVEPGSPAPAGAHALGFALFVRDRDLWHGLVVGTDYDDPRSRSAYFEVVYYAPLDAAGRRGIRRISYGLAASRTKALRGCELEPIECLLAGVSESGREAVAHLDAAWTGAPAMATG